MRSNRIGPFRRMAAHASIVITVLAVGINSIECVAQSSDLEVVDIREIMPDLEIDSQYAGPNNFLQEKMYSVSRGTAYATLGAIRGLRQVRADLNSQGYDLRVWDAYRPLSVQWLMWSIVPDPRFVADPRTGSNHNRGAAIDVTLLDLATGAELDMGTEFDDFSDRAAHGYQDLELDVRIRRAILQQAMDANDFSSYFAEWWHYTHNPSANDSPLYDYQMK